VFGTANAQQQQQQQACTVALDSAYKVVDYIDKHDPVGPYILAIYPVDMTMDPDQLLGLPGQYTSKAGLTDERVRSADAYVEVFATRADRAARLVTLQKSTQSTSQESYLAVDRVLLRLPSGFTPEAIADYRGLLNSLCVQPDASAPLVRPSLGQFVLPVAAFADASNP
jgi:hypothetical protein